MWEAAYGEQYKIQVSDDDITYRDVKTVDNHGPGWVFTDFTETEARYVRMQGIKRGTQWSYSIYEFEIYHDTEPTIPRLSIQTRIPRPILALMRAYCLDIPMPECIRCVEERNINRL